MTDKIRTALMTAYCLIVFAGMVIVGVVSTVNDNMRELDVYGWKLN